MRYVVRESGYGVTLYAYFAQIFPPLRRSSINARIPDTSEAEYPLKHQFSACCSDIRQASHYSFPQPSSEINQALAALSRSPSRVMVSTEAADRAALIASAKTLKAVIRRPLGAIESIIRGRHETADIVQRLDEGRRCIVPDPAGGLRPKFVTELDIGAGWL